MPAQGYLAPGTRLGRYELRRMLAVGGMAEIHLARATGIEGFQKLVVLKRILPHLAADPEFIRLFLDEARLAATLHHPNVVEVFDIGSHEGSYFFTMEYVRGQDLGSVIAAARTRGEGLLLENALAIVIGVAEGLHHAHEMRDADGKLLGLVHRDVSPSNVLITYGGAVKVCDFGIAKAVARQARTTDGSIKGKASYMSPEQCRGEGLDRRSDVFAIGILLYELTTGRRLFRGANELEVFRQITERDVTPPTSFDADYPPSLEPIVLKALARDPAERYATAQELQLALESFARDERLLISSAVLGTWMAQLFPDATSQPDRDDTPLPGKLPAPEALAPTIAGPHAPALPVARTWTPGRIAGGLAALALAGGLGYGLATRDPSSPAPASAREVTTPSAATPTPPATIGATPGGAAAPVAAVAPDATTTAGAPASVPATADERGSASSTALSPTPVASDPVVAPPKSRTTRRTPAGRAPADATPRTSVPPPVASPTERPPLQ